MRSRQEMDAYAAYMRRVGSRGRPKVVTPY